MKQLRSITWPNGSDPSLLPDNIVADKDQSLMYATKLVLPELKHILYYVHIMNSFMKKFIQNIYKTFQLDELVLKFAFLR